MFYLLVLSGLSISNETFAEDEMADMYADCGNALTGARFFLDDLAVKRLPAMKYTASTCRGNDNQTKNYSGIIYL
jgi:hypothetical protein